MKAPLIKNIVIYFILFLKTLYFNRTKTKMELRNISEANLGTFIGSNDVRGVTNKVTASGVKKLTL